MQKEQFQESSSSLPVICHVLCHTSALGAAYPHWRPNFSFLGLCLCGGSKFTLHSTSSLYGLSLHYAEYRLCAGCVWCHFPHPNQGMRTAHGLKLVHRPVLFCMWNSTVLLKFFTLNSSVRAGLSRAPLSPAPPVV